MSVFSAYVCKTLYMSKYQCVQVFMDSMLLVLYFLLDLDFPHVDHLVFLGWIKGAPASNFFVFRRVKQ